MAFNSTAISNVIYIKSLFLCIFQSYPLSIMKSFPTTRLTLNNSCFWYLIIMETKTMTLMMGRKFILFIFRILCTFFFLNESMSENDMHAFSHIDLHPLTH